MNNSKKFRVWDKAKNKFINPFLFERDDYYKTTGMVLLDLNGKIRIADYSSGNGDNSASSVYSEVDNPDNYIVQEYTGLTDKNGKEIYEGDIVKFDDSLISSKPMIGLAEVIWINDLTIVDAPSFGLWFIGEKSGYYCSMLGEMELVGNIFEHKHLLEK